MENAEEIFHFLEDFSKRKTKTIPQELNDYLAYVARTGDPVYQWSLIKSLFKEKLLNVITDFYEATPSIEIPLYPNVDPFNYDIMKNSLLERLDTFTAAPFTVQRICELLTFPRKQYNRVDKYMRAIEKNILVVSTREPGNQRHVEIENGEPLEPMVNGSDNNSDYSVDVEMEDMSWKETNAEPQPEAKASSSDTQAAAVIEKLEKEEMTVDTVEKVPMQYESVTPPEENIEPDESEIKPLEETIAAETESVPETSEQLKQSTGTPEEPKVDVEMKTEEENKDPINIPEIKVDDAEMTEQRLLAEANTEKAVTDAEISEKETVSQPPEPEPETDTENENAQVTSDESDSNKEESKTTPEVSSSEESSSSDNTDASSNSPKTDIETSSDPQDLTEPEVIHEEPKEEPKEQESVVEEPKESAKMQSEEYSIADVKSEVPVAPEVVNVPEPEPVVEAKVEEPPVIGEKKETEDKDTKEVNVETKES